MPGARGATGSAGARGGPGDAGRGGEPGAAGARVGIVYLIPPSASLQPSKKKLAYRHCDARHWYCVRNKKPHF